MTIPLPSYEPQVDEDSICTDRVSRCHRIRFWDFMGNSWGYAPKPCWLIIVWGFMGNFAINGESRYQPWNEV